jgi:uncharacterized protein (DUF2249 family)
MIDSDNEGQAEAQSDRWVRVDARWLEPPEPMERVLNALFSLRPGQGIHFLIHREPIPLYSELKLRGFSHHARMIEDDCYEITIERRTSPDKLKNDG